MDKSESIKELAIAMCKAQERMGGAHKGANNPFFKSKYADLGAVVEAVKEPFAINGLSYVQFPIEDGGRIGVETILMHESGEWMSNKFTVQLTKQDAQGAGSAITYCRRYGLQAIAGIPSADDDGNAAQKPQLPSMLKKIYQQAREHYDAGDLQAVREVLASFEMIEQQRAVMLEFSSSERTAITKYVKENAANRCEVQKADYLTAKEHDQLCKNYGFNG
jgi:hypothetical protein